jgi:hypothetical protein
MKTLTVIAFILLIGLPAYASHNGTIHPLGHEHEMIEAEKEAEKHRKMELIQHENKGESKLTNNSNKKKPS